MLSIGLIVLLAIDLTFLTYGKVKIFLVFCKNGYKNFNKMSTYANSKNEELDTKDILILDNHTQDKIKSKLIAWIKNAGFLVFKWGIALAIVSIIIAFLLVIIGIATASIWGTILLAIYTDFVYASVFLIGINLVFFLLAYGLYKAMKIDKSITQRALIMDTMLFSMLVILLYFAAFGYPINVNDIIEIPFKWDIVLNNLASILLPMLFFSIITINSLSVIIRIRNMMTKNRKKHKFIRIHQLLFIFITSCFIGIVYLTDIDLSFMNDLERSMYLQTLEVVKWIVTSAFIPMFLYTLNNYKKAKTQIQPPRRRTSSRM